MYHLGRVTDTHTTETGIWMDVLERRHTSWLFGLFSLQFCEKKHCTAFSDQFSSLLEEVNLWPYQHSIEAAAAGSKNPTFLWSHFAKAPLFFHKGADNQQPQHADKENVHRESMSSHWSFTTIYTLSWHVCSSSSTTYTSIYKSKTITLKKEMECALVNV